MAEAGSIATAAARRHLSASAISRQIKALEESLGVSLLERAAHSIHLTPAGEMLARDAGVWVEMADRMADRVREIARGDWIRVAYASSLAGPILGPALESFAQRHPAVRVQLFNASTLEMKQGLHRRRFDLIVTVPDSADDATIAWLPLARLPWQLAVVAAATSQRPLALDELGGQRLLIYHRDEYPDY